jgi:predicted alpha/beta superfamily hydrolase
VDNDQSSLADTEVHYLWSASTGAEFKVFIGHCGDPAPGDTKAGPGILPVLYVLDANGFFGLSVDIIRSMQLSAFLPPMLVVGIGYRAGTLAETVLDRTRDLTPTVDANFTALFPRQSAQGGAQHLHRFLVDELFPWVEAHYGGTDDGRILFGHSLGGLFGTYVLVVEPETFSGYIISSPSLWWHGRVIDRFEEEYASTHDDLDARVVLGIGSEETQDGRLREAANLSPAEREIAGAWPIDMVDDLLRLAQRLEGRGYPGLDLSWHVYPDEFHITVPQLCLSRGLRTILGAPR